VNVNPVIIAWKIRWSANESAGCQSADSTPPWAWCCRSQRGSGPSGPDGNRVVDAARTGLISAPGYSPWACGCRCRVAMGGAVRGAAIHSRIPW